MNETPRVPTDLDDLEAHLARLVKTELGETIPIFLEEMKTLSDVNPINVARQRTADLVRNIADNTKLALKRRRDEIDNTIARIEKSETALIHYIGEFAQRNHEGLELAIEIEKLIAEIATPFKADPPTTLTQESKS